MTSADVARSFYNAVGSGDLPGGLALIAPDCAWTEMESFAPAGVYHGPDEVREQIFFRIGGEWEGFAMTVDEVREAGDDTAVGVGTYSGTFKASGRSMEARVVHVFSVRDGKIVAFEQFTDTLKISEAKAG
jgi:ketosteroid isomerase-like protein